MTAVALDRPRTRCCALCSRACSRNGNWSWAKPCRTGCLPGLPRHPAALREAAARLDRQAMASGGRVTRAMAAALIAAIGDQTCENSDNSAKRGLPKRVGPPLGCPDELSRTTRHSHSWPRPILLSKRRRSTPKRPSLRAPRRSRPTPPRVSSIANCPGSTSTIAWSRRPRTGTTRCSSGCASSRSAPPISTNSIPCASPGWSVRRRPASPPSLRTD